MCKDTAIISIHQTYKLKIISSGWYLHLVVGFLDLNWALLDLRRDSAESKQALFCSRCSFGSCLIAFLRPVGSWVLLFRCAAKIMVFIKNHNKMMYFLKYHSMDYILFFKTNFYIYPFLHFCTFANLTLMFSKVQKYIVVLFLLLYIIYNI